MTHPSADLTRQRLIRAALELFTTKGYHDTTTAQIAKKAGIAEGTIYRHFASKQQLANEIYRAAQRWAAKVVNEGARDPQTGGAGGGTARTQLTAVAHALMEGAARDTAIVKLGLLDSLGGGAILDDESRRTEREFRVALERVIAEGKAQGTVRAGAVEIWSAVWLAAISHALAKVVAGDWKPGDTGVRLVIEAAWKSISA